MILTLTHLSHEEEVERVFRRNSPENSEIKSATIVNKKSSEKCGGTELGLNLIQINGKI